MKKPGPKQESAYMDEFRPYENLMNAIILQAVLDFESLISDAPISVGSDSYESSMTVPAIRHWAKGTKVNEWLDKIERTYKNKFRPYSESHAKEIAKDWKKLTRKCQTKYDWDLAYQTYPHKCPLCGGALRPKTVNSMKTISCNGCNLNVMFPLEVKKKCSTAE